MRILQKTACNACTQGTVASSLTQLLQRLLAWHTQMLLHSMQDTSSQATETAQLVARQLEGILARHLQSASHVHRREELVTHTTTTHPNLHASPEPAQPYHSVETVSTPAS